MTGDMGDYWNDVRDPPILLPQQRCKVCGYRDPRPRIKETT